MKKLLFLLFMLSAGMFTFGQKYEKVTFFGVDFSLVKVYGADNSPHQFRDAFHGINRLFITEPHKYDVGDMLAVEINALDLNPVEKKNDNMDLSGLMTDGYGGYELTDQQIKQAVQDLAIVTNEGIGVVIIAEVLNKPSATGSYHIVYFDIPSKNVLESYPTKGKARGFGLRNYWARSVLQALKNK